MKSEQVAEPRICTKCGQPFIPTPGALRQRKQRCRPCRQPIEKRRAYWKRPSPANYKAEKQRKDLHDPKMRPKFQARWKLKNAIRRGAIMPRPCYVCGNPKAHAHHHDYSKPLDVVWICSRHHFEEHRDVS